MADFKAGFDAWRKIGLRQQQNEHYASALIELKQRVKALEDAHRDAETAPAPAPRNSLVERVRQAQGYGDERHARAAIRAVAAWLRERGWIGDVAQELEREVDRG